MRPDHIPQDIWDAAKRELLLANTKAHMLGIETDPLECLSSAILAERERCANIAANWRESQPPMVVPSKQYRLHDVADEIAHAIRNPRRAKGGEDSGTLDSLSANNANFKRVQVIGSIE
jgi:hypothetical protein